MGRTACTEPQCLYKGALYLYLFTDGSAKDSFTTRAKILETRCALFVLRIKCSARASTRTLGDQNIEFFLSEIHVVHIITTVKR